MDTWEQKLKDSGIYEAISILETKLGEYDKAELSIEDRGYLDKIRAVNDQIDIIVKNADPKTVNNSAATSITNSLSQISSYLDSWGGGTSSAYLSRHAIGQIDAALQQTPLLVAGVSLPEAKAAITKLRQSAARQNTIVNEITEKIRTKGSLADETIADKITTFSEEIEAQSATAKKKLDEVSVEAREISEQLDEARVAANKLATEQNEAFNTSQTKRTERFEQFVEEQGQEAHGLLTSISSDAKVKIDEIKQRSEQSAKKADEARVKSEELLGIVSQNALISDYSKNGLHEQKWSRIWQIITLVSLLATVAAGAILALGTDGDTSWQKLIARFGVLIATGGLATYAAAQASEHRRAQRHSEHLSLQLSAVRPYLAGIDNKPERDKLLVLLAEKFFGERQPKNAKPRQSKKKDNEGSMISGDDLPGLIGALISVVNTTSKK